MTDEEQPATEPVEPPDTPPVSEALSARVLAALDRLAAVDVREVEPATVLRLERE
jgi:hypothetical protein